MEIKTEEGLRELYGFAKGRAKLKQLSALEKHSKNFIAHSPFVVISTVDKQGRLDSSPRGGEPGFVQVLDDHCIIIADSKGNNRLDSLVNIIETQHIGCLFMIPGIDETLRLNGRASISTDEALLKFTSKDRNPAKTVIKIQIDEVYLHCAKAMMRSKLWAEDTKFARDILPSMSRMIGDQVNDAEADDETQEQMIARYKQNL